MLQSLLKRRFGEHDETDLAPEIESFESDISKYEQQSNDLIKRRRPASLMVNAGIA